MRRIFFSGFLLMVVLVMGQVVYAGDGTANTLRITISPVLGEPGTVVSVLGTGADPAFKVVVTLAPQAGTADGAFSTVTITPADDGTFETSFVVPDDIAAGRYYLRAEQFSDTGNAMQYYWNGFTVGAAPESALLPETCAIPGTPFTVTAMLALLLLAGLVLRGAYAVANARRMI